MKNGRIVNAVVVVGSRRTVFTVEGLMGVIHIANDTVPVALQLASVPLVTKSTRSSPSIIMEPTGKRYFAG